MHKNCRRDYTRRSNSSAEHDIPSPKKLRSSLPSFNWKRDCILCDKLALLDTRHPERSQVHKITTLLFKGRLLECCHRRSDSWELEVERRLHGCIDLVFIEAVYHSSCYSRFILSKQIDKSSSDKGQGRPQSKEMSQSFNELQCMPLVRIRRWYGTVHPFRAT